MPQICGRSQLAVGGKPDLVEGRVCLPTRPPRVVRQAGPPLIFQAQQAVPEDGGPPKSWSKRCGEPLLHYPMPRCCGGPCNLANIRAAHSLCNGSTSGTRPQAIPFTVTAAQSEVINQILALQAAQDR